MNAGDRANPLRYYGGIISLSGQHAIDKPRVKNPRSKPPVRTPIGQSPPCQNMRGQYIGHHRFALALIYFRLDTLLNSVCRILVLGCVLTVGNLSYKGVLSYTVNSSPILKTKGFDRRRLCPTFMDS